MKDQNVIEVNDLYKDFILPHQSAGSVKNVFTNMFSFGSKSYETQHALKDINFSVKKGEFLGIVGRNGSGKSTLLKLLAGIYQPTKGSITTTGRIVPFIELGVGFNGELTGRENVYLNGALLGFSEKEINTRYQDIVDFAEIERFMDQKLKNYSSGMQVRLAFSVATVLAESDILLIDEVLAVGDADFQKKCFEYFRSLKKLKKTVIFVSHDMGAVRDYCDRAILVDNSRMVHEGRPDIIASYYHRLFTEESTKKDKNNTSAGFSGEARWGDGKATITKVDTKVDNPKKIDGAGSVEIAVTIVANEDIEEPITGFSVKNTKLAQLLGTNTQRKKLKISSMKKGDQVTVIWTIENMFNEGEYYVDATIACSNASSVADRWPDASKFEVFREDNTPYEVYPNIRVTKKEG